MAIASALITFFFIKPLDHDGMDKEDAAVSAPHLRLFAMSLTSDTDIVSGISGGSWVRRVANGTESRRGKSDQRVRSGSVWGEKDDFSRMKGVGS